MTSTTNRAEQGPRRRGLRRTLFGAALAFGLAALTPLTAEAAAGQSASYGNLPHEGRYSEQTACSGRYTQPNVRGGATKKAVYQGRTITLKYFHNSGCGSFARIENAPQGCAAHSNRLDGSKIVWVLETVDPGIDYASTKVINNLDGRRSRAVLICDNQTLASTAWY
ncbi:hypothetical protein [Streptomyces botrytidirepellens]|uniref:Secreted protein n=1 Tax=Streptomyces botrytidirepellens TaxID=2486417 RepID=A0A3M8VP23_9ACTN|nr:hypothetical protein [Streptomyces botrytidirepellens]RNG19280.1 hypothetical protein EEJ42_24995 [Streptomyces botrytidirepellens]